MNLPPCNPRYAIGTVGCLAIATVLVVVPVLDATTNTLCAAAILEKASVVEDDDKPNDGLQPGLLASYTPGILRRSVGRVDADVQFDWDASSPDLRVPVNGFLVRWAGKLFVPSSGRYWFHVFVCGDAELKIAGKRVVAGKRADSGWVSGGPVTLELGHHDIVVGFAKTVEQARIGLYWESERFGLEPVTPRWLFHEAADEKGGVEFDRGFELARAYRCAACHEIPGLDLGESAPTLDKLAGRIHPDWLVEWLESPHRLREGTRMPELGFSKDDARAVAAFLLKSGSMVEARGVPGKGQPETGEVLVRTLGCLACHTLGDQGTSGPFGGGPLDRVAQRRPASFFSDWLRKPEQINPRHRMPVFTLSNSELDDLTAFLAAQGAAPEFSRFEISDSLTARGRELIEQRRCAACHDLAGIKKPPRVPLPLDSLRAEGGTGAARYNWEKTCAASPDPASGRPGFKLPQPARHALQAFLGALPHRVDPQSRFEHGRRLLRELNCTACHARELERGLEPAVAGLNRDGVVASELAKLRGEIDPPSLTAVGDKFHDETLAKLIQGGLPPRRPWLKVRMPRFAHSDTDRDAIVHFLVEHDRIPEGRPAVGSRQSAVVTQKKPDQFESRLPPSLDPASALTAGHQLVSSRGFGCMSCHTVGKHQPKGVAANARGSDLLKIEDRVRHDWFLRWTRDPARIVPGMEMPSITAPVRGLLADRLDLQIESLWTALNSPSFVVPSDRDTAQQVISLKVGDQPVILRDVMYDCPPGSGWCPRPLAIGLPNRHNVLFDLDTRSLRGWWVGDFARERTEGKTWLWEPAGLPMWDSSSHASILALRNRRTGEWVFPPAEGLTFRQGASWSKSSKGAWLGYTLRIGEQDVAVEEFIEPVSQGDHGGFARRLQVRVSPDFDPLLPLPSGQTGSDPLEWQVSGPLGVSVVRPATSSYKIVSLPGDPSGGAQQVFAVKPDESMRDGRDFLLELRYLTQVQKTANDSSSNVALSNTIAAKSSAPATLSTATVARERQPHLLRDLVPGCVAHRVAIDPFVMPTAIAFQSDGTPIVSSLKGQVFLAKDTDQDGFEDQWLPRSDHLAAPFGLLVEEHGDVLVSHKPEVIRLRDVDGDGRVDMSVVVASGWGLTEDYHDWTFGPVRDATGNLYIGTGSDYTHKDRPEQARKWRGRILRISPDGRIEELAHGARYPTGLAINREGAVFFTDNQGVQNTFNEINHVIPGSRYGVPALDDPPPDKDPWPERSPAIQIPHPWTRSVNGICFLESEGKWGPFEGHGIGCDYDTHALIRFSLQKIGDTYQGACYPFTIPEEQVAQDERLLGPICCAVSPGGELYVGGIRDSGWGGGNNVGELVRIKPPSNVPLGIREVRATRDGFQIDFTGPIDAAAASDRSQYVISSYHRIWKGSYATPDSDRRVEAVRHVEVAADRTSVKLTMESMRPGFVYDMHVNPIGPAGQSLWPAEAYYTLNQLPHGD